MQKRTEITIETERLLVISHRRGGTILWCNECARNVPMLPVYEATRTSRGPEADLFHFAVTPEGRRFVCSNSLALESTEECSVTEPNTNSTF